MEIIVRSVVEPLTVRQAFGLYARGVAAAAGPCVAVASAAGSDAAMRMAPFAVVFVVLFQLICAQVIERVRWIARVSPPVRAKDARDETVVDLCHHELDLAVYVLRRSAPSLLLFMLAISLVVDIFAIIIVAIVHIAPPSSLSPAAFWLLASAAVTVALFVACATLIILARRSIRGIDFIPSQDVDVIAQDIDALKADTARSRGLTSR
jgi:hypothetical protein